MSSFGARDTNGDGFVREIESIVLRREPGASLDRPGLLHAAHAQIAGHLTGSEERGGCKSLGWLRTTRGMRVRIRGDGSTAESEPATLEIRVRFPVTAPERPRMAPPIQASLRSSEEGAPHKRGQGSPTLPVATAYPHSGVFQQKDPRL